MKFYLIMMILLFICFCFSRRYKKGDIFFILISFFTCTLVAGLRSYSVGVDTSLYVSFFENIHAISFSNLSNISRYEYGFSYFCKLISLFTRDYHIFLLITSFIINYGVFHFIKNNSKNYCFSVLLYICCNFFLSYMNIMREALAISIVLIGFEFFKNKKYLIFSLFVFAAMSFHFSAIVCFLLIPFRKLQINRKTLCITFLLFLLLFIFGKNIFIQLCQLSPRMSFYINSSWGKENLFGALFNFLVIFLQFLFGLFIIYSKKKEFLYKMDILFPIMILASALSILVMRATIFDRFLCFFSIFSIIWTPNVVCLIRNTKTRLFYSVSIYTLFLCYFIIVGLLRPEWNGAIPYVFGY